MPAAIGECMNYRASPRQPLSQREFIALTAFLFATVAFSIDSMLPALPRIAADLTPDEPNRAQLILSSFVLGMGVGTLLAGPISDAVGRRPAILGGVALYLVGAAIAAAGNTLDHVLLGRVIQGLGAAGPRVVALAVVRDLHSGRRMAQVISLAMMIFTLVPALAPALGMIVIAGFGWRGIFGSFMLFASFAVLWFGVRQPETLPPERRNPLNLRALRAAGHQIVTNRIVMTATLVQTLAFSALFSMITSIQPIFDQVFDRAAEFPLWFAAIAGLSGGASLLNARLVVHLGMRFIISTTLGVQSVISLVMTTLFQSGMLPDWAAFPAFFIWGTSVFLMGGLVMGNVNALAMEPVGHIAGTAASIVGSAATVLSALIATPVGLAFNGTPVPLMASVTVFCAAAWGLMRLLPAR